MGLDAVELVLRAEEFFVISISDEQAAEVRSVGDFYCLICAKLEVMPLPTPFTSEQLPVLTQWKRAFLIGRTPTPLSAPPEVLPWSAQSVWDCLVVLFVDQMGLKPEEITYNALIVADLGID